MAVVDTTVMPFDRLSKDAIAWNASSYLADLLELTLLVAFQSVFCYSVRSSAIDLNYLHWCYVKYDIASLIDC